MIHRFRRCEVEHQTAAVARARADHGPIGGSDVDAYLEMCDRGPYRYGFTPYPQLIAHLSRALDLRSPLVADFGCGPGNLARDLLSAGAAERLCCIDLSPDMLEVAAREAGRTTTREAADLRLEDICKPMTASGVNIAIFKGTAHHLTDLAAGLRGIRACMAPSGVLLMHDFRGDGDLGTAVPFIRDLLELSGDDFAIWSRILGYVDSRRVAYSEAELAGAVAAAGWQVDLRLLSPDEAITLGSIGLAQGQAGLVTEIVAAAFRELGFRPI